MYIFIQSYFFAINVYIQCNLGSYTPMSEYIPKAVCETLAPAVEFATKNYKVIGGVLLALYAAKRFSEVSSPHHSISYSMSPDERKGHVDEKMYPHVSHLPHLHAFLVVWVC